MDIIKVIEERENIQKFENKIVRKEIIEKLLGLATKSPLGENRQPWRFVVVQDKKKNQLVNIMTDVVRFHKKQNKDIGNCKLNINSINEAPIVILVFNAFSDFQKDYNHYRLLTDTQSIGAVVQTMILAAQDFGLDALWICDIFYCNNEICSWLNRKDELVAAVAIGYPNQYPYPCCTKKVALQIS